MKVDGSYIHVHQRVSGARRGEIEQFEDQEAVLQRFTLPSMSMDIRLISLG
jgi:hypothetical protein